MPTLIDRLPAPLANKLRTKVGTQFVRFALVAAVSLGASEIALFAFIGPMHLTGGVSGVSAAIVGAVVSYFLSRWAWERKGRPSVLRETIPFWLVSVGAWLVLGLATKLGLHVATSLHLHHLPRHLVVGGIYFLANCITFMIRFLIFHYVLFSDGGSKGSGARGGSHRKAQPTTGVIEAESLSPVTVPASSDDPGDPRD
jgi:putative flippase GtrA